MRDNVSKVLIILITVALFVIVVDGMRAAASIINPFLLAVFLSSLCAPLLYWLQRRGVPNGLAVAAIVLGLLVVALLLMIFVGRSLNTLAQQLPVYQERLTDLITQAFDQAEQSGFGYDQIAVNRLCHPKKSHEPGLLWPVALQGFIYEHVSDFALRSSLFCWRLRVFPGSCRLPFLIRKAPWAISKL